MSTNEFFEFLAAYEAAIDERLRKLEDFTPSTEEEEDWKTDHYIVVGSAKAAFSEFAKTDWTVRNLVEAAPGDEGIVTYEELLADIKEHHRVPLMPANLLNRDFPEYQSMFSVIIHSFTNTHEQAVREKYDAEGGAGMEFTRGIQDAFTFLRAAGGYHRNVLQHPATARRLEKSRMILKPAP